MSSSRSPRTANRGVVNRHIMWGSSSGLITIVVPTLFLHWCWLISWRNLSVRPCCVVRSVAGNTQKTLLRPCRRPVGVCWCHVASSIRGECDRKLLFYWQWNSYDYIMRERRDSVVHGVQYGLLVRLSSVPKSIALVRLMDATPSASSSSWSDAGSS